MIKKPGQMNEKPEFIALMQEHRKIVFKVVRMYAATHDEQQDLQQEIMLQAWKSYPQFKGAAKFSTWLYKLCLNTALSFRARNRRHEQHQSLDKQEIARPEASQDQKEWLYMAIRQLPEVERGLIGLHLDGYANEEIGEIAGIKTAHVSVKLFRIKQKLSTLLKTLDHGTTRAMGSAGK